MFVRLAFPGPGITLYPGIFLKSIGAGFGLEPFRLLGDANLTIYQIFGAHGLVLFAFPTAQHPFVLTRAEAGPSFPDALNGRKFDNFTFASSSEGSLQVPNTDLKIALGGGYMVYSDGYFAFGGNVDLNYKIISLNGGINGEFNFANGRFNLDGHVEGCIADVICAGLYGSISSVGIGGCASLHGPFGSHLHIGGGIVWPDHFNIMLTGCDWGIFHDYSVTARAATVKTPLMMTLNRGSPGREIRLQGTSGAPSLRVTDPSGQVLESTQGPGVQLGSTIRILRSNQLQMTQVALIGTPGRYKIETLPGSAPITSVATADTPAPARITAHVSGSGARRRLTYDIRRRPGQQVTFLDVSASGSRAITTVAGGRGSVTFTPAPGHTRRQIQARFELAGLQSETRTVASFAPPNPVLAKPASIAVSRRQATLRVAWRRVPGATAYEITATLDDGTQLTSETSGLSATIRSVAASTGGQIAVRAVATLRQGPPRTVRFRATARRPRTRFGPLPRPPKR